MKNGGEGVPRAQAQPASRGRSRATFRRDA